MTPLDALLTDVEGSDEPEYPEWVWRILLWIEILQWLEYRLVPVFYRIGIWFLRWGMAVIFIWFGLLKLFAPPPVTAQFTIALDILPAGFPFLLGAWEFIIGVCFLQREWMRYGIWQLKFHMPGTFLPLIIIPDGAFAAFPLLPALPGLYIIKNLIFIGAGFILWADLLASEPDFTNPPTYHDTTNP